MITGLTGKNAAGKGVTSEYLKSKGFIYYSLSDFLREEATKRGLLHTRDNLINLGNELRAEFGSSFLAIKANERINKMLKMNPNQNFVIDSIRSPYEVKELMKNKKFILVSVEAPIEMRFERIRKRNRTGDAKSLEELRLHEEMENTSSETSQQLDKTISLSKKRIVNDGSFDELYKKIDDLLIKI